jgi:hypothetical protein
LEPEWSLSYGNISVFSIFHLRATGRCAIVIHGKGAGPRTKSATLSRPPADGNTHQRITIMAKMKKKHKKKKAAKKS